MDQQNNNGNTGAPSTDTTSALFVSARKKQLEQQEADRQAKEREDERLAAEAEVRRLEHEVAERRRRVQEEAERVEQEAAIRRQQAQQEAQLAQQEAQRAEQEAARARAAQAAQPAAYAAPKQGGAQKAKFNLPVNKWVLIGGGAVLLLAVVLIVALSGGGSVSANHFTGEVSSVDGLSVSYPETWSGDTLTSNGAGLYLQGDDGLTVLAVMDMTSGLNSAVAGGTDAVTAAEGFLYDVAGVFASGSPVTDMEPQLIKSGSSVQGSAVFLYQDDGTDMQGVVKIESIEGARTVMSAYAVPEGKTADKQSEVCEAILGTLMIGDPGDIEEQTPYWETDERFMLYFDGQTGIQAYLSTELEGEDNVMLSSSDMPFSGVTFGDKLMLIDFTYLYRSMMEQGGTLTDVIDLYLGLMEDANGTSLENVLIGEPVADATGTRIDFSFDMEGATICALRLFEADDVCMIAIGHDLDAQVQEYFYVMAESMCIAVG